MFAQKSTFFDNFFIKIPNRISEWVYSYIILHSNQNCLLTMLHKLKKCVDKGKVFGALITDLLIVSTMN